MIIIGIKKKKFAKKNNYDFSHILEKRDDLILNKYYISIFDKYNVDDYSDGYVVLFYSKTGDGKTTAINAFFNIVKGVQLEDNYRFILIFEPKKKIQAESKTDGIYLYYLKDYNNKPITIIAS